MRISTRSVLVTAATLLVLLTARAGARPTAATNEPSSAAADTKSKRGEKSLAFYQYLQPPYLNHEQDYDDVSEDENEVLSRAEPGLRRKSPMGYSDSPIYYIRLPPSPYVFVPGLGYVSRPPPPALGPPQLGPPQLGPPHLGPPRFGNPTPQQLNPFINVPVDFISNGKPTNIYQWAGAGRPTLNHPDAGFHYQRPRPPPTTTTTPNPPSAITNLHKGPYVFNGRPSDMYVLRNSYNSLYADALQNFYP